MLNFIRGEEFCLTLNKLVNTCNASLSHKRGYLLKQHPTVCDNIDKMMAESGDWTSWCEGLVWKPQTEQPELEKDLFDYAKKNMVSTNWSRLTVKFEKMIHNAWSGLICKSSNIIFNILIIWSKLLFSNYFSYDLQLLVDVFIKDSTVTRILRDEKLPVIWFMANIGGLLGLCTGFSFISFFEIVYHIYLAVTAARARGKTAKVVVPTYTPADTSLSPKNSRIAAARRASTAFDVKW